MRARMALAYSEIACELREVVLRDKPGTMLEASPKGTVPVLVLPDGEVLDESLDIINWALAQNDPEGWGLEDNESRALITRNDGTFKHHLDRYKYPGRYGDTDPTEHRAAGLNVLRDLDMRLSKTRYLRGETLSLTDIALAPFIRQFANTDRTWFDAQDLPHLQAWLSGILESPVFTRIMPKYSQWQPGDPVTAFPPAKSAA